MDLEQSIMVEKLVNNIHQYQFQQVMRILQQTYPASQIRFTSTNRGTFPGADIQQIEQKNNNQIQLALNFMGLYGVDSSLPHYINNMTLPDSPEAEMLRNWFDVIAQQVYQLFFLAWQQTHSYLFIEQSNNNYLRYLRAISAGLLTEKDNVEYSQAALLGGRNKTATGLAIGLKHMLNGMAVTVKQFVPSQVVVSQSQQLGIDHLQLTDNIVLGCKVISVQKRVTIILGVINWQQAKNLWPDQPLAKKITDYIKRYLPVNMRHQLQVKIDAVTKPLICLGKTSERLAWSTWLGEPLTQNYVMQIG